jgi:hypothetical protein
LEGNFRWNWSSSRPVVFPLSFFVVVFILYYY